jgi:hypothetical protein
LRRRGTEEAGKTKQRNRKGENKRNIGERKCKEERNELSRMGTGSLERKCREGKERVEGKGK